MSRLLDTALAVKRPLHDLGQFLIRDQNGGGVKPNESAMKADHRHGLKRIIERAWALVRHHKCESVGYPEAVNVMANRAVNWHSLCVERGVNGVGID